MSEGRRTRDGAGTGGADPRERFRRRDVSGILVLDKPVGMTSNKALQKVRRLYRARKAGHTGSLDPLASGVLPICLGEATKISGLLLEAPKTYEVIARLGVRTDTGDAEGRVVEERDWSEVTMDRVLAVMDGFRGRIEQVPPMYSALKQQGRRLYELARRGETVERPSRRITIYSLDAVRLDGPDLEFRVRCSKGTYVRTLVEDLAAALGTVAHVSYLRRVEAGSLDQSRMVSLSELERLAEKGLDALDTLLQAPDEALPELPAVHLDADQARRVQWGQRIEGTGDGAGTVRLYGPGGAFLGLGQRGENGVLAPRRLFCSPGFEAGAGDGKSDPAEVVADSHGEVQ